MILALYLLVVVLAAGATHAYAVREDAIPFMTLAATGLYGLAALQGGTITIYDGGSQFSAAEPAFQYLMLGFSVLSFTAFLLWYWGVYPPGDAVADEPHPEGERNI